MSFQIFPDPSYPFGGIRVVVQQAFKEARISAAVNGFDMAEPQGQAPSQPQTAGVGVGFIFLFPASETGNKEHRRLEEEGQDIVLEADERAIRLMRRPRKGIHTRRRQMRKMVLYTSTIIWPNQDMPTQSRLAPVWPLWIWPISWA